MWLVIRPTTTVESNNAPNPSIRIAHRILLCNIFFNVPVVACPMSIRTVINPTYTKYIPANMNVMPMLYFKWYRISPVPTNKTTD